MTQHALAPRPTVWARPTRAPSTWRAPASPRSWCTSSTTWPSAGRAERFALRQQAAARVHRPRAAERDVAVGEQLRLLAGRAQVRAPGTRAARGRRRCPGTRRRRRRPGPMPASSYASRAASVDGGVMSVSSMPESGVASPSTLPGQVRTQPGRRERARRALAPSSRCSTIAAAPSLGEHSIHRCSGSHTSRDASTSSAVTSLRNIAFGLCTPLRRFFTTTSARCVLGEARLRAAAAARAARSTRAWPRARPPRATARRTTSG